MELLVNALTALIPFATDGGHEDGGFHPPTIMEFFPDVVLFDGTIFAMNRIMMMRLLVAVLICVLFWLGTRKMTLVPGRGQSLVEMGLSFVRKSIAHDLLGEKTGDRFLPVLTTIFFMVLGMNLTGIIPGLNIAGTSVIGIPLLLAVIAYGVFIYAGLKQNPKAFIRNSLVPPGVPKALMPLIAVIEFISTFILRPITLTLRLLMNMVVGHLLLVLFFAATQFFIFTAGGWYSLFGIGTFAFGLAFTLFEILIIVLQAYIFTLLTAVYIQLAVLEEH
ncbi:F0F1 ATP synthase subunit A [Homoserinimonas sp. A447]